VAILTEDDFKRLYQQEWPPATMTKEQYDANRGCSHRAHDCACRGECPWRLDRERKLAERQRNSRRPLP
jgi:hypothetical protein